jgi:thiol:disulfide interchange protein DsbD
MMNQKVNMKPVLPILVVMLVGSITPIGSAPEPVQVDLLADVTTIKPGSPFTIGVHFKMKPGWHIYWQNPGDSGLPTSIEWTLPKGFTVGPVQWPIPKRFNQPGNIVGYGYTDSVLLSARVTPPRKLALNVKVPVSATVAWLSCEKVCIPGEAKLDLTLPVSRGATPNHSQLFEGWKQRLPIDGASGESPLSATTVGHLSNAGKRATFRVLLRWHKKVGGIDWFPLPDEALTVEHITLNNSEQQTRISFVAQVLPGQKLSGDTLNSLIVYQDEKGSRKGVNLPIKLRQPPNPKKG